MKKIIYATVLLLVVTIGNAQAGNYCHAKPGELDFIQMESSVRFYKSAREELQACMQRYPGMPEYCRKSARQYQAARNGYTAALEMKAYCDKAERAQTEKRAQQKKHDADFNTAADKAAIDDINSWDASPETKRRQIKLYYETKARQEANGGSGFDPSLVN